MSEVAAARSQSRLDVLVAYACLAIVAVVLAAYLHLSLPKIPDRDALYHFRHAALYRERGPFMKGCPWMSYSVISALKSDIWYGFHLFLLPFTLAPNPVGGVKVAGVFDLAAMLMLCYAAMRSARTRLPFLWPFVVLAFAPFLLYRLLMTRPHVLSMGFSALLLSLAVSGSAWGVALASLAITFTHLGFFWVIPLIIGVVAFTVRITEGRWLWRESLGALAGGLAGWLLRPNPVGAAKIVYAQIVQLAIEKQKGAPILFGGDLVSGLDGVQRYPADFFHHFLPALVLWAGASLALLAAATSEARLAPRQRTFLWSSFGLSAITLLMMLRLSVRSVDLWAVFAVALAAGVYSYLLAPAVAAETSFSTARQLRVATAIGALLIAFMVWHGADEHTRRMRKLGYPADRLKLAAQWLGDNSSPAAIVFEAHWDLFPDLFFWNTKNRYVGGMDPIFQYAYDPKLYWKAHHLYTGRFASYTCATPQCGEALGEDTFTVLRRDFKASYLVLEQKRHRALFSYARDDPRFHFVFDDGEIAVFRLVGDEEKRDQRPDTRGGST